MQDSELPINMEELPNFQLANIENQYPEKPSNVDQELKMKTAFEFINKLQDHLTGKITDEKALYILYDFEFNNLCKTVFESDEWPAPEKMEEEFSKGEDTPDVEFDYDTQIFYNELRNRHTFARLQNTENFDMNIIAESWENYKEVFDTITRLQANSTVCIPSSWAWDIIDEFIYQFQIASKQRASATESDSNLKKLIQDQQKNMKDSIYWNLADVISNLQEVIKSSEVIKAVNGVQQLSQGKNKTLTHFGHYALVGLLRVYVITSQFDKAIEQINLINFQSLSVFSSAVPSYLTLFYYAGTCFLMSQRYREAVNLFETILLFFFKYKKFLTKSFQYDNMCKQAEKCSVLLILSQVFYPQKIEETIQAQLEETFIKTQRQNKQQQQQTQQQQESLSEKAKKLANFDSSTFNEIYNSGFIKPFYAIQDSKDFVELGFNNSFNQQSLWVHKERLEKEFMDVKYLNDISSILKIYANVKVSKVGKLLDLSGEQLDEYLEAYRKRNNCPIRENVAFESSVLKHFLKNNQNQIDFKIENGQIFVSEISSQTNFAQAFQKQNAEIVNLEQQISKIGHV